MQLVVGAIDVLKYLIKDCECDLSTVGIEDNKNVFHYSAGHGHYSLIKYIIDHAIHNILVYYILLMMSNALPIHYACS